MLTQVIKTDRRRRIENEPANIIMHDRQGKKQDNDWTVAYRQKVGKGKRQRNSQTLNRRHRSPKASG